MNKYTEADVAFLSIVFIFFYIYGVHMCGTQWEGSLAPRGVGGPVLNTWEHSIHNMDQSGWGFVSVFYHG